MSSCIASHGTSAAWVELYASVDGFKVTLTAVALEWCAKTGLSREDTIGTKTVESEEAEDAASDLQGIANDWLDEKGNRGWAWRELSFSEAARNLVYA